MTGSAVSHIVGAQGQHHSGRVLVNFGFAFQVFREPRASRLDDGLPGLRLVPIMGGTQGRVPAALKFGAVSVGGRSHDMLLLICRAVTDRIRSSPRETKGNSPARPKSDR